MRNIVRLLDDTFGRNFPPICSARARLWLILLQIWDIVTVMMVVEVVVPSRPELLAPDRPDHQILMRFQPHTQ